MKYTKSIVVIVFINILIAFVLIFVGHKTRNLEIANSNLNEKIKIINEEININQLEFTYHNDNNYLIKLYSLYHSDIEKKQSQIIKVSEFLLIEKEKILKVKYK